jgi:hypothetical protein
MLISMYHVKNDMSHDFVSLSDLPVYYVDLYVLCKNDMSHDISIAFCACIVCSR